MGPSPRVRGSPRRRDTAIVILGSIPRVCGEAEDGNQAAIDAVGPSPRVRGSLFHVVIWPRTCGSIPTCAGKPLAGEPGGPAEGVHPRVCGEACRVRSRSTACSGPSPRVRGSPAPGRAARRAVRSIPACAGKPLPTQGVGDPSSVHPRVCGEARGAGDVPGHLRGSIPACAGKPGTARGRSRVSRVHPRVCGEASRNRCRLVRHRGPSPRVRGSPGHRRPRPARDGSIPACAGKPSMPASKARVIRVHPRVCGEADWEAALTLVENGPSPRVRGSLAVRAVAAPRPGSIPACAGKPSPGERRHRPSGVHPRVCGEAASGVADRRGSPGPSPRVRGSRHRAARPGVVARSIPACAGKPSGWRGRGCRMEVHPRVCGEALDDLSITGFDAGPSPRVRGSLDRRG